MLLLVVFVVAVDDDELGNMTYSLSYIVSTMGFVQGKNRPLLLEPTFVIQTVQAIFGNVSSRQHILKHISIAFSPFSVLIKYKHGRITPSSNGNTFHLRSTCD